MKESIYLNATLSCPVFSSLSLDNSPILHTVPLSEVEIMRGREGGRVWAREGGRESKQGEGGRETGGKMRES